jgi:hypothetical protein
MEYVSRRILQRPASVSEAVAGSLFFLEKS